MRSTSDPHLKKSNSKIELNLGDKESSSDLETGAEPHRLELEEEFGWRRGATAPQVGTLYPLLNPFFSLRKNRDFR